MPRPETTMVTLTIDGREVQAPEGAMLVDGAKYGDVEIPVFCYEPKLGNPVGACRMCLVEIEGIPKLQTACSTPVKDGMVVHTLTERVQEAQRAVVEFLLINHPLDCPVCDKGGECPLQDISYGWGGGTSRFIEPKRHFEKPLELSPLIAIDRERCIMCYRCARFSQEIAEDHQLVVLERGVHSYIGTFDGHPYVAPFSGNITELCPVGALTSRSYRFRARPWDIEGSGSVCTLCPAQCNVEYTVRDDRVLRVLARDNDAVDDGWLCDKGRYAFQAVHADERIVEPMVRDGGELRPVSWERALETATSGLARMRGKVAALAGGGATNEEGFLLGRLLREGLDSPHLDAAGPGGATRPLELSRALAAPALQATVADLEFAHAVLVLDCEPVDDAPILDLRIRKGVRRRGVRLAVATSRPSSLDPNAELALRFAPGAGEALLAALDAALAQVSGDAGAGTAAPATGGGAGSAAPARDGSGSGAGDVAALAAAAGADAEQVAALARLLAGAGGEGPGDVVILWGERIARGARGADALRALLNVAGRLDLRAADGAGLLEVTAHANGRGLREAGVAPNAGPGYAAAPADGYDAEGIARALAGGELTGVYLLHADPLCDQPDRALWEDALDKASLVVAHASVMTETLREHATVIFPAEAGPEKEGTLVHPDGRLQRLRPAIGRPRGVRPEWQVLAKLAEAIGHPLGVRTAAAATQQLVDAVPFYAGLTLEEIGGRGVRWPEREAAGALGAGDAGPFALTAPPAAPSPNGALALGTFRSIWAASEIALAPALEFLAPGQTAELAPADAERLGVRDGETVEITLAAGASGGEAAGRARVRARATLRGDAPAGTVFLQDGLAEEPANALTTQVPGLVEVRRA